MQLSGSYGIKNRILKALLISSLILMIPFVTSWTGISNIALVVLLYTVALYLYYPVTIMDSFTFALVLNLIYIIIKSVFETSSIVDCLDDIKRYLPLIVSYIILCHIKLSKDRKFTKNLVHFMLIVLFIRYISAIVVDLIFPNTARMIAGLGIENPSLYYKIGAGSYSLINSGFLLILPLFYYQKNNTQKRCKVLIGIFLFVEIISTIVTNWATAVIFSLLAILVGGLIYSKTKKSFVFSIVMLIFIFCFMLNINLIVNRLDSINFENPELYSRLSDIIYTIAGIEVEGDLSARRGLYSISINSINNNIITGNMNAPVGGHAFFLDYVARYGLIGFMLLIITYIFLMKISTQFVPKRYRRVQILNFILYFAFGCVKNVIGYEFLLNLFVLGPLIMYISEPENHESNIK